MGIINRDLATSQQRESFYVNAGPTANGATGIVCTVPALSSVDALQVAAFGTSGAPTLQFIVNRFTPGTGATPTIGLSTFAIGGTFTLIAFGTSGVGLAGSSVLPLGSSFPVIGSTTTTLQANDVIMFQTGGGAGAAVTGLSISLVLRPLNDQLKYFGQV